jgi:hypothetical protein
MKMLALAAAATGVLAYAIATPSFAQPAAEVPPLKCGAAPNLPGERMMEDPTVRRRFDREMKTYGDCVKGYVAERQETIKGLQAQEKAHMEAANKAVNDYNALMKAMTDAAK